MNGVRNRRNGNLEKPFPGCLGRMVNLFDLSAGMVGNRLLTDKPHRDGDFHILILLLLLFLTYWCLWNYDWRCFICC